MEDLSNLGLDSTSNGYSGCVGAMRERPFRPERANAGTDPESVIFLGHLGSCGAGEVVAVPESELPVFLSPSLSQSEWLENSCGSRICLTLHRVLDWSVCQV